MTARDLDTAAEEFGINTCGSFILTERPPPPPAPYAPPRPSTDFPPPDGCDGPVFSRNTLRPSDFHGLGLDERRAFSVERFEHHLSAMPTAYMADTISRVLATPGRQLQCQAFHCTQMIRDIHACQLCAGCLLSVVCGECAGSVALLPCRQCLRRARITRVPAVVNALSEDDRACIYLLVPGAAYVLARNATASRTTEDT
jgi:hypothetical protein